MAMPGKNAPAANCPPGKEYVFRRPNGQEAGKAKNAKEFVELLKRAPLDCILYHANNGHFAPWLAFMGLQETAQKAKGIRGNSEDVRRRLIALF